jgi:hypothetical protein
MKVRALRDDETYCLAYPGTYRDREGNEYYLSHPQVGLVSALWGLRKNRQLQLEYLKYAFIWTAVDSIYFKGGKAKKLLNEYLWLAKKFHNAWSNNTKYLIIGNQSTVYMLYDDLHKNMTVSDKAISNLMDEIDNLDIVLHKRLEVEHGRSVLRDENK